MSQNNIYNSLPANRQQEVDREVARLIAEVKYEVNRGNGDVFQQRIDAMQASIQPGGSEYKRMQKMMSMKQIMKDAEKKDKLERKRVKKMEKDIARQNGADKCMVM